MSYRDDKPEYEMDAAREAFLEQSIRDISEDNSRGYLGSFGDAIDARVADCMRQARELFSLGYHQPALVLSVTAIEIIVRFFLIRPLVQGAFLSDEWAYIIAQRVATGRSAEDRKLLPEILGVHGIDIRAMRLPDGKPLWDAIVGDVYKRRDRVIHAADPATAEQAQLAIDCAAQLRNDVVRPLAKKLGFTLDTTGCWSKIHRKNESHESFSDFTVQNPFQ